MFNNYNENVMKKPRIFEVLQVAVEILKLIIKTAADIIDDGRINGSAGDVEHSEPSND